MPRVAFTSDYCMHALLGFSALHKAHMEPEIGPALRTSAVDHLDKALVGYREHSGPTTAENADAKFAFTWLVVLFAYAIPPSVSPINAMTELFLLVKGIDSVLAESWFWVSQGPFAPILTRGFQEAITLPPEAYTPPEGMDLWAWRHLGRAQEQCLYETRTLMRTSSFPSAHGRGRGLGLSQYSDWLRASCFLALRRPRRHSFVVVEEVGEKGADLGAGSRSGEELLEHVTIVLWKPVRQGRPAYGRYLLQVGLDG
ncbi:hypothetical protein B0A54_01031 [Friedmanniomyces endolithicus]|uniref:Uncharacterized protein n=1 Tax=Friedmanniomyces endolithicus TaxID=329885 RepID=A0A4U0VKM5_9PEZI|nr:hypothetical protein LTS09_009021 [Friedmanniomyces endolithicus]TKA48955.1 hypothetical protein B0A54_01031 [Friedmanniomyces endolithicus]